MISAEIISATGVAVGGIISACLGAWSNRLSNRISDLEGRVKAVEAERDKLRHLFRASVRYIRQWIAWGTTHAPGVPHPTLPPELNDEV